MTTVDPDKEERDLFTDGDLEDVEKEDASEEGFVSEPEEPPYKSDDDGLTE